MYVIQRENERNIQYILSKSDYTKEINYRSDIEPLDIKGFKKKSKIQEVRIFGYY